MYTDTEDKMGRNCKKVVKTLSSSQLHQSPVQIQVAKRSPTDGRDAARDNSPYLPIVLFP